MVDHIFIYLFAFYIFFIVRYLFQIFACFLMSVYNFFLLLSFRRFFPEIYFSYQSFVTYMFWKDSLPICDFCFHFFKIIICKEKFLRLKSPTYWCFSFMDHAFDLYLKSHHESPDHLNFLLYYPLEFYSLEFYI